MENEIIATFISSGSIFDYTINDKLIRYQDPSTEYIEKIDAHFNDYDKFIDFILAFTNSGFASLIDYVQSFDLKDNDRPAFFVNLGENE
jgi:hypothetical protein